MARLTSIALGLLLMVACGGDKDASSDDDGTDGLTPTPTVVDTALCDAIPVFNLDGMSCDQITSAFEQTMSAARDCITVDDCHAESGQCTRFRDSGCWYAVNYCVDVNTVNEFADRWASCQGDDQCTCAAALELQCLDNKCAWIE